MSLSLHMQQHRKIMELLNTTDDQQAWYVYYWIEDNFPDALKTDDIYNDLVTTAMAALYGF